jgi:accessory gene regulator B
MIEGISEVIIEKLYNLKFINNNIPIYRYGTELLVSAIIGFFIIIIIGVISRTFTNSLLFLTLFVSLRHRTGGYHSDNHFKCNLLLIINYIGYLLVNRILIDISILDVIGIISLIIIIAYSPLENINKRIKNRNEQKIKATILSVTYLVSTILLNSYSPKFMLLPVYVLTTVALYLLIGRGQKSYDK